MTKERQIKLIEVKVERPVKSDYTARVWMSDRRQGQVAITFPDRRKKRSVMYEGR